MCRTSYKTHESTLAKMESISDCDSTVTKGLLKTWERRGRRETGREGGGGRQGRERRETGREGGGGRQGRERRETGREGGGGRQGGKREEGAGRARGEGKAVTGNGRALVLLLLTGEDWIHEVNGCYKIHTYTYIHTHNTCIHILTLNTCIYIQYCIMLRC